MSRLAVPIVFADVNGNPLPANMRVDFYPATNDPSPGNIVASAYIGVASQVIVALHALATYRVQYVGEGAPTVPSVFTLADVSGTTIIPGGYVSPWADLDGYADLQAHEIWQLGRVSNVASSPGGGTRVLMETFAATLAQLDIFGRTNAAGERLLSSSAAQVDSWVADFLGTTFPRMNAAEPDGDYVTRVIAWLGQPFTTLAAIQNVVAGYFAQFPDASTSFAVFDRQSDPAQSAYFGLTPGQIAIAEYYANTSGAARFFVNQSFLGQDTYLDDQRHFTTSLVPIYPELDRRIRRVKAGGAVPVYIVARA